MRKREFHTQSPQEAGRENQSKPGNQIKAFHSPQFSGHLEGFPSPHGEPRAQGIVPPTQWLPICSQMSLSRSTITRWAVIAFFSKLFSKLYLPELPKKENQKNDSLGGGSSSWDQKKAFSKMLPRKGSKSWILRTSGCPSTCTKVLQSAFHSTLTRWIPKKNRKKENKTAGLRKQ